MCLSRSLPLLVTLALVSGCSTAARSQQDPVAQPAVPGGDVVRPDFSRFFGGIEGTFVLLDAQTGHSVRYNVERARTRFLPASTFKIPNALIALETGIASGPDFLLSRDSTVAPREGWWPAAWSQDHTLRTALPISVVWYFQELARRIGAERLQAYLERFRYGNQDVSGGTDQFWLTGGLRISPDEQVEFLRRFYDGELGLAARTTELVKEFLVLEETARYRLSGKTGWARLEDPGAPGIGWLVGYVERGEEVYFFATNIGIRSNDDARARLGITKAILDELGLLD